MLPTITLPQYLASNWTHTLHSYRVLPGFLKHNRLQAMQGSVYMISMFGFAGAMD